MRNNIRNLAATSLFTSLFAVCSYITVPFVLPFTLQTLALFLCLMMLGGKRAAICIAVYLALGAAGVPVFSMFGAGIGTLFGATGGYLLGFLPAAFIFEIICKVAGKSDKQKIAACAVAACVVYLFGTLWYGLFFAQGADGGIYSLLSVCVFPFVIPDIIKLCAAYFIYRRLVKIRLP